MSQRHEDSDDDTYVTLGSAFEKLETIEDVEKAKRKKDKEHYVTDDKGRRRFHGAFTGGFSAGYFNTVGSEEGWTPSTFVSSRAKKSEHSRQRPEDFMDAEDLGDYGIAPRAISTKEPFTKQAPGSEGTQGVKRDLETEHSVIPGAPALQNLIVPARSSVGARLLKTMGWKEGQGVGPKTAKYGHKEEGAKKMYGCALPGQAQTPETHHYHQHHHQHQYPKEVEGFLFAPRDVSSWEVEGKDDMHGIGYRGIEEQQVLGSRKTTKALYGMSGEAFGVGALEDEDADEDNVYGTETLTSYDSTLALEGDISMERKFGWTGGSQAGEWGMSSFKKASKHTTNTKKYPPPDVPRDFSCRHSFTTPSDTPTNARPSVGVAAPPTSGQSSEGVTGGRHKPMSSVERSQLLSDSPNSVFNLLSISDREKLRAATEQAKSGRGVEPSQKTRPPATTQQQTVTQPPALAIKPAVGEVGRMKPFAREPEKAARYEAYLAGKPPPATSSSRMTEWERQREEEEFSRLAKVFTPLNTALSSRFTKGEEGQEGSKGKGEEAKRPERALTPESDAVQAAKANMFGVLTRETVDWHPHRLLCKRFNIPDPYPNSSVVGVSTERRGRSLTKDRNINFIHTERILPTAETKRDAPEDTGNHVTRCEVTTPTAGARSADSAQLRPEVPAKKEGEGPVVAQATAPEAAATGDTVKSSVTEGKRPPMDLFKAIFAESSSDSDSGSVVEMEDTTQTSQLPQPTTTQSSGRQWQDLSVVTNTVLQTKSSNSSQPKPPQTHKQSSDKVLMSADMQRPTIHGVDMTTERTHTGDKYGKEVGSYSQDRRSNDRRDHTHSSDHTHIQSSWPADHTHNRHTSIEHDHGKRRDSKSDEVRGHRRRSDDRERDGSRYHEDKGRHHGDSDSVGRRNSRLSGEGVMEMEGVEVSASVGVQSYGPALPPELPAAVEKGVRCDTSDDEEDKDAGERSREGKKTKHSHHHKKRHKAHKEHKKHKHKYVRSND